MRKIFSLILAVSLLFIFTACSMTNDNSGSLTEDLKDGADNLTEDTKDMADDLKDDLTANPDTTTSDMPEGSVDGTMENTETVNPNPVQ